ncbi:MAG: RNA methyltransferase, partial [Aeriscardovia sp.]|nr:RNA methyltransferase [Aeriscardovia sp.]
RYLHPQLVVLDPPRAGAKRGVCQQLAQARAQTIIYIACNPTSLARDTKTMLSLGYRLASLTAFDIYPMTHHVETVALFQLR